MTGKPQKKTETVTRFEVGADQNEKREFARKLVAALEAVGVEPGQAFVVMGCEHMDDLEEELRDSGQELEEARGQVKDADSAIEGIKEIVADYGRGILDRAELLKEVRLYATYYV